MKLKKKLILETSGLNTANPHISLSVSLSCRDYDGDPILRELRVPRLLVHVRRQAGPPVVSHRRENGHAGEPALVDFIHGTRCNMGKKDCQQVEMGEEDEIPPLIACTGCA